MNKEDKIYYAGIGSRQITSDITNRMKAWAGVLEDGGYILRSGGAKGSDQAFESGVKKSENKVIYRPTDDIPDWAFKLVKTCLPTDYTNPEFDSWKPYVKNLLARNMMQVFGDTPEGNTDSKFILCWVPIKDPKEYWTSKAGGTGYALRLALKHEIPIFNMNIMDDNEINETMCVKYL